MIENVIAEIPEFVQDAFLDCIKLIPSLLIIFAIIEIFENFFANKIANIVSFSKKLGPILGSILAIIPQCGFSVLMTTLFIKKYITIGTLLAVYIATSDEAIPVLLANPEKLHIVIKIILIKLIFAIAVGYLTDLFIKTKLHTCEEKEPCSHIKEVEYEQGCCNHNIKEHKIRNIILHPIKHTFVISLFIFGFCLVLNFLFQTIGQNAFQNFEASNPILEIIFFSIFGLVPNCAVSVLIAMMYLKGTIAFSSVIAGLCSNAGLGLLVLFTKKESLKKFLIIIGILVLTGILAGLIFQFI